MKLSDFKLESYFAKWEFKAQKLLCASDSESWLMQDLIKMADNECRNLWNALSLSYTETQGMPLLRKEIAKIYQQNDAANILCFAGGQEGIFCALSALLSKEDHAIVITPCYQSLQSLPEALCQKVSLVPLNFENSWDLDISAIEKAICSNTSMIIMNYPHNPTGALISAEQQQALITLARKHNLIIFCDEVYRYLEIKQEDRLPAIADVYEKGISLSVMSKSYGLGGLRIGWLASQDQKIVQQIAQLKHYTSLCNSAPSEILTLIALRNSTTLIERNRKIMLNNQKILFDFLDRHNALFSYHKPKAGPICFALIKSEEDSEAFCMRVLEKTGILLLPGTVFNYGKSAIRLSFARKDMPEVLNTFEAFLTS